jgi:iron complex outermembrane recepter protein
MRTIVRGLSACTLAGLAAPLWADDFSSNQYTLEIERQPIVAALTEFSRQTGLQVGYLPRNAQEESTIVAELKGQYTAESALQELLAPSGLLFERVNEKTLAVMAPRSKFERVALAGDAKKSGIWGRFRLAEAEKPSGVASKEAAERSSAYQKKSDPLEEVIVTAQKRAERLEDVPISISVVRGGDLDSSSFSGVTEILNTVPGVATTVGLLGGGTQVAVRGVTAAGSTFAGSSPIAYYVDSVPFGFVRTAVGPDLGPYDLDRIEVLRGPQGTLYGASALNGVVRVLTQDADLRELSFKARTSVSTTEAGGGNYGGDAAVNVPLIDGKLAARAVVGYQDQSGWLDTPVKHNVNDAKVRNYRLKINAAPTEQVSIGLSAWRRRDDYGAPSLSDDDFLIPRSAPEPISTDVDTYGLNIGYEASAFSIASTTSFVDYKNLGAFDGGGVYFVTHLRSKVFSQELVLNSDKDAAWRWTAGAFYRDGEDLTKQQFSLDPVGHAAVGDYDNFEDKSESLAFFGEIGRRFANDRWEWTVGLRHFNDDVSTRMLAPPVLANVPFTPIEDSFDSTTPRAVLTWFPNEDLTLYASYSEGFRSGFPQDELVMTLAPEIPSLEPDHLKNYEIGAKGSFGRRISFDAAVFYIEWDDVQQVTGVPLPDVPGSFAFASVNGESASGVGCEFALNAKPFDALDVRLSASWNDLRMDAPLVSAGQMLLEKGDRLSQSPEYTANASAEYSFALGASGYQAQLMAAASYTSEQKSSTITGAPPVEGDAILISRLRFTIEAPEHWSAALFVDNLNDERGTPVATIPGLPQYDTRVRPRTVGAQLEYRF